MKCERSNLWHGDMELKWDGLEYKVSNCYNVFEKGKDIGEKVTRTTRKRLKFPKRLLLRYALVLN